MPLPKRFPNRDEVAAVRAEAEALEPDAEAATTRRLAGRVMARRDLGKLMFLDLADRSGRIQLLVRPDELGGIDLDLGDIVGVEGGPTKSRRGEPSLAVRSLELLAKIRAPLPDTHHGITDVEQRYRRRYLDLLMNDDSRRLTMLRTRIVAEIRAYLDGEGFLEVETPILQPRYGGGVAEPLLTHSNELARALYLRIADELVGERDERRGKAAAVARLEDRRFDLEEPFTVEVGANFRDDPRSQHRQASRVVVHQQIEVAATVALLDVRDAVVGVRQRRADLRQQLERADGERRLAAARFRRPAFDADDV